MRLKYTFIVYAYSPLEHNGFAELNQEEAIVHMRKLLNSKSDFADVDFELHSAEIEQE